MSAPIQVTVPFENVNDPTAKIVDWKVASGGKVKAGDSIVELETTKTTFPVLAPADGYVEYNLPQGEEVPVGDNLFRIHADEASAKAGVPPAPKSTAPIAEAATASGAAPLISKKAQDLMTANGLDASHFTGLSSVKESDVRDKLAALGKGTSAPAAASTTSAPSASPKLAAPKPPEEPGVLVQLTRAKQMENRELLAASREVLKSSVYFMCPAAGLTDACARQNPPVQRLVVILSELAKLLKKYPAMNAYLAEGGAYHYQHVNLGFAVDMGRGLKVLVVHEAETLNFSALAERVEDLLVKYTTDTLTVRDLTGSTFTITDLAGVGVFTFEPLINVRQAAILGIGAETTVAGAGGFMLSCAFDHRLNSGKQVAEFLGELSARLTGHAASLKAALPAEPLCCSRCLQTVDELRALSAFLVTSVEPPGYICNNCLSGH